ncbi:hypothetical protein ICJ83_01715 [Aestuariibaculum sp. TT11]|uniref:Uncharacterized protein n=1 Tax=Aestuariibaculum sediminum TaxID=2770637 RepID=A0A8J6Q6J8_9FLAO|nr:hypothetical protein [Aestuariibaculum sediminum]
MGLTNSVREKEDNHGNNGFSSNVQAIIDIDGVVDFMAPVSLNFNRKADTPDVT